MIVAMLIAFYAIMVGSLTYAWVRGGDAERTAVLLLAGFFTFRLVAHQLLPPHFATLDPFAAAQDFIGFAGFVWIGLRARRYWPLIAAALQLLSLSAHIARAIAIPIHEWAYALTKSVPTLLVYIVLIIGTANYARRVRRWKQFVSSPGYAGPVMEPSWRRRSNTSPDPDRKHSSSLTMTDTES